uniref:UDP-3-O-[3-hydroxymyristoyl] glucosamine N-acyltransferase n=1 Tax=Solanum tuberosum TaxID=4113 RepID=M1A229_SOLTU
MLEVSSSKPLASESKGFAFWVELVAPGLPSAVYLSYVVCELLHRSGGTTVHLECSLNSRLENGGEDDQQGYERWGNGGGTFHKSALIDPSAFVEVGAVVHSECAVGADCHIGSGAVIGPTVTIGQSTKIGYNVALANCIVGDFCAIHSGVCIGQDGFGFYVDEQGNMVKKPQTLKARIENHVEIGANTCIDRGSWRDTVVGEHTKIDNLVQIGHNVVIGRSCLICGQVGVAGSVTIGDYVTLGGRVGIRDHVNIASKVDHMFDKIPEKGNDLDSSDITSLENNRDTFEEMHYRPSLIISSVLSVYDQMVTVPDLSDNTTNDEAISFPNKVLSELPHDQSSREGGQHVRTTSLSLCAFGVHNDNYMNPSFLGEVVDDAKLMKAITAVKYWKMVVVGREYNDCELPDDLGLFSMDEVIVKHFRISTTRMFDDSLRWFCAIGCGHKVARSLIGDPNFSWTVIFKEFVLKDIDKEVDKAFPSFTNIYLLVDAISAIGSTIVWNARIALLEAGMVVQLVRNGNNMDDYISGCFVRLFLHFVVACIMDVVYMIHLWTTGVIDNGGAVNWTRTYQIAGVAKRMNTSVSAAVESYKFTRLMSLDRPKVVPTFCPIDFYIQRTSLVGRLIRNNFFSLTDEMGLHLNFVLDYISTIVHGVMKHLNQLNQGLPLVLVKFCTNPPFQALSYKYQPRGVCCRDICHFRGGMVLVKVGQDVQEVRLAANSCVTKDISVPGDYGGFPAIPIRDWRRQIAKHRQILK